MPRKSGKIIATRLTDAEYKLFCEVRGERTSYEAMKDLIRQAAEQRTESAKSDEMELQASGNFEQDVQRAEQKPINTLEKMLNHMTNNKTMDTKIKKHGAYHDENTLIDIMNMIKFGRPTMLEVKWVIDFAYIKAVIAEAIIRKGAASARVREVVADFKWRPDMRRINPHEMARRNPRADRERVVRDG